MTSSIHTGRRAFVKLAAAAALTPFAGRLAHAAGDPLVLGTWGGDTEKSLASLITASKTQYGIEILLDIGTPSARKTKLLAQMNRRRNAMDIPFLVDSDMHYLNSMEALLPLDKASIPNYGDVQEEFTHSTYSVPIMYSALILVYSKKLGNPPKSIKDLWNPEYAGKVAFTSLSYDKIIPIVSHAFGTGTNDFTAGYDALLKLKESGVRLYASNEAVGNAFQSGEIDVALMWKGRAHQWIDAGLPIAYATPAEGVYPVFFEMAVTRNSGLPKESLKVLGEALTPKVQQTMAISLGQIPVIRNSGLPPKDEERLGFNEEERKRFIKPDYGYLTPRLSEMLDFWNQRFKG
ncbi:ABC transporter substrate-binding protein [Castellaniella sp.]|uniref:ABC transporter substrate-binding protein n=1 Tax=Castellaniella sp. TaxID=1955812 RepID=UPI003C74C0CD